MLLFEWCMGEPVVGWGSKTGYPNDLRLNWIDVSHYRHVQFNIIIAMLGSIVNKN